MRDGKIDKNETNKKPQRKKQSKVKITHHGESCYIFVSCDPHPVSATWNVCSCFLRLKPLTPVRPVLPVASRSVASFRFGPTHDIIIKGNSSWKVSDHCTSHRAPRLHPFGVIWAASALSLQCTHTHTHTHTHSLMCVWRVDSHTQFEFRHRDTRPGGKIAQHNK